VTYERKAEVVDKVQNKLNVSVSFILCLANYSGISISTRDLGLGITRPWVTLGFRVNVRVYGYG